MDNNRTNKYQYFIYLRKSDDYDLCLALANSERGVYRGFEFESHELNDAEICRMFEWANQYSLKVIKDPLRPKFKETILVDNIKFPVIGSRILLEDRIYCHKAIIKNGPQHISDSEITMFISEPAKIFRNLCFSIYPPQISLLDLWSMNIPNSEFQPLLN
jgi:hypothetical protein